MDAVDKEPGHRLAWYDLFTININWLGLMSINQALTAVIVPLLIQQFVGESGQGGAFGRLRLWVLMTAVVAQAGFGLLSDHTNTRYGRRRPYILVGILGSLLILALIGELSRVHNPSGYPILFALMLFLAIFTNSCHAGQQSLISDLVPPALRGRFSGVKAFFEVPLPLVFLSLVVGPLVGTGNFRGAVLAIVGLALVTLTITMFAPERANPVNDRIKWGPILRLFLMTGLFICIILGSGAIFRGVTGWLGAGLPAWKVVLVTGLVGLSCMAAATVLGVWMCIQVGLGPLANQRPGFIAWVINRLAFLIGATNLASFLIYYLQARLNLPGETATSPAAFLTMLIGIAIILSVIPGGWLVDHYGKKQMVVASCWLAASGILIALASPSIIGIGVGGFVVGLGTGLFYTANWALGTSLTPDGQAGRYLGISNLAGAGAGAIGAYIGGPIADSINLQYPANPALGYMLLFAIYGLFFLLALLPLRWIRDQT